MSIVQDSRIFKTSTTALFDSGPSMPYNIEETYWGYIIRGTHNAPAWIIVTQLASWIAGIILAIFAIGIMAVPGNGDVVDHLIFKVGASVPLAVVAGMLFWYASRGHLIDIEFDTSRGEIREVLRNHSGRSTLIGLYGFDSIGGVFLERHKLDGLHPSGQATLVLRYRNTAQILRIASGEEDMLTSLRDRLGRDLMVRKRKVDRMIERAMATAA
jgi:hypothetical protein